MVLISITRWCWDVGGIGHEDIKRTRFNDPLNTFSDLPRYLSVPNKGREISARAVDGVWIDVSIDVLRDMIIKLVKREYQVRYTYQVKNW